MAELIPLKTQKYLSFSGENGCYATLPSGILGKAKIFTIEVEFSTQSDNCYILECHTNSNTTHNFRLYYTSNKLWFDFTVLHEISGQSQKTNSISVNAENVNVNDGNSHKVAVVSDSTGFVSLYCDGKLVGFKFVGAELLDSSLTIAVQTFNEPPHNRYSPMNLHEMRFWSVAKESNELFEEITAENINGLRAWYLPSNGALNDYVGNKHATLYGNVAYNETPQSYENFDVERKLFGTIVAVDFDVERKPVQGKWKYVNLGTADLLTVPGTNLTPAQLAPYSSNEKTTSKTGVAFYQTAMTKCFDIPATKEIWIRADIRNRCYSYQYTRWRIYNHSAGVSNGISLQKIGVISVFENTSQTVEQLEVFYSLPDKRAEVTYELHTFVLHMVSGNGDGIIELWIDGEQCYSNYSANINNGNDLADIFLQSDGEGSFFSNVVIANYDISNDGFQNISFDIRRKKTKPVSFYATTLRAPRAPLTIEAEGAHFYQKLFWMDKEELFDWVFYVTPAPNGVFTIVGTDNTITIPARDEIWLRYTTNVDYDDSRKVFIGDEEHATGVLIEDHIDNCKILINGTAEDIPFDYGWSDYDGRYVHFLLHLKSGVADGLVEVSLSLMDIDYFAELNELAEFPTYSRVGNVNNGQPITTINMQPQSDYPIGSVYCIAVSDRAIDIKGNLIPERTPRIIDFDVILKQAKSLSGNFDVRCNLLYKLLFDLEILRVCSVNFNCDIQRQIPHRLIITPVNSPEVNTTSSEQVDTTGVQSIQIELAKQQLTDKVIYTSINPANIMEEVRGQYLDYKFDMRIEEITQNGILYTCHCCSDVDALLYTQLNYIIDYNYHVVYKADIKNRQLKRMNPGWTASETEDVEVRKSTASLHMHFITLALRKQLVSRFEDFVSDMEIEQKNITYSDLISNLFGWTSRLPQLMIHCYFRDDKIYVIQRGHEDNEIDITNLKHTLPTINLRLMRTAWGSAPDEEYTLEKSSGGIYLKPPPPKISEDGKTSYTYKRIHPSGYLLVATHTQNDDGSSVDVNYSYTLKAPYNLTGEHSTTRDSSGEITDEHYIHHNYLTPSQTHYVWDEDGNNESSVVGSHVAGFYDETITLFEATTETKTAAIPGNPLIDPSFPVVNQDTLAELSAALRWLNRKTQETISMDIYDFPHVIDFNDRIIFNGATYFLESNSVEKTPRIVNKQSIQIVRWY